MAYSAIVVTAFISDANRDDTFDIWESTVTIRTGTPAQALHRSIEICRTLLEEPNNWRALGYSRAPSFYAVKSLHTIPNICDEEHDRSEGCKSLIKIHNFDKSQMERIAMLEEILVPFGVIHVG